MVKRSSSPPYSPRTKYANKAPNLLCTRIILLLLTTALTVISLYFSYTLTSLTQQLTITTQKLQDEQSQITQLSNTVSSQQTVIDRFADSITNADVEQKLNALEDSLKKTEKDLMSELTRTEASIQTLLNRTVTNLDKTVTDAETQIHEEVLLVKKEVDQYVRTTQDQFSMENSFMVYQLAGTFTLLASLISMWHMTSHLRKFKRPVIQRKILAILWMSPIYGVTSWLSLVFPRFEGYLAIVKDFYEAYVIYTFLGFLVSVLGRGDRDTVVDVLAQHADHLEPPMRCCGWCRGRPFMTPHQLADAVLLQCQIFCMQFVFLKPLTVISLFVCNKLEYYGPYATSRDDYRSVQFWINIVQNISVGTAFSGLLKFYHAVHDDLAWCRPFPKFLCIKGIVFMTFWQGLAINFLANTSRMGGISNGADDDPDMWGKQSQNFLICLEMLLFSIAHFHCFPVEEWQDGYRPEQDKDTSFGDNFAMRDFFADLHLIMRGNKKTKSMRKKKDDERDVNSQKTESSGKKSDEVENENLQNKLSLVIHDKDHVASDISSNGSDDDEDDDDDDDSDEEMNASDCSSDGSFNKTMTTSLALIEASLQNPDVNIRKAASRLQRAITSGVDEENQQQQQHKENHRDPDYGTIQTKDDAHSLPIHHEDDDGDEEVDEKTGLLAQNPSASSQHELRPSIFTHVDSMHTS